MDALLQREFEAMADRFSLGECFECGCSAMLSSHIPLVQQFRIAKSFLKDRERARESTYRITCSTHQHIGRDVPTIMRNVVYSMLPICAFSVWQYGLSAAALILVVTDPALLPSVLRITFQVRPVHFGLERGYHRYYIGAYTTAAFSFMDGRSSGFFRRYGWANLCSVAWAKSF